MYSFDEKIARKTFRRGMPENCTNGAFSELDSFAGAQGFRERPAFRKSMYYGRLRGQLMSVRVPRARHRISHQIERRYYFLFAENARNPPCRRQ